MSHSDYVIVGGGVVGVCAAYHLARRGERVLLLERDTLCPTSPRSSSGDHAKAFRFIYGSDQAMTRRCLRALALWRRFEEEAQTRLFERTGMVVFGAERPDTLAHWRAPALAAFARQCAPVLKAEGLPYQLYGAEALRERYPQIADHPSYDHAILDESAGLLSSQRAVRAIGELAREAGAEILEQTEVIEVVRVDGRVVALETSGATIVPRKAVILAAGYMNPVLSPHLASRVRVTRQQLLYLEPSDPAPYHPAAFPIVVDINSWRYVFPTHGHGVVKVADDDNASPDKQIDPREGFNVGVDGWFRDEAQTFLGKFVPGLKNANFVGGNACLYTNTVDERYLIERHGNEVLVSACSGHGFKNGPMTALRAVGLALGEGDIDEQVAH